MIRSFIAVLLVALCLCAGTAFCQDSTSESNSLPQNDIFGLPAEAVVTGMVAIILAVFTYLFLHRRTLRQKERELELREREVKLKEAKADQENLDRLEKREAEINKKRDKVKYFDTFEERYFNYLYEHHRWLKTLGLKTRTQVSIDLKSVYVPLRAYRPSERLRDYTGDFDYEKDMPSPVDERHIEFQLRKTREVAEKRLDIAGILRERKRIVILGGPGCGKTTLLGYLALAFAQKRQKELLGVEKYRIPICIACRDLNPEKLPNPDEFHEWCLPNMLKKDKPDDFFKTNLENNNCLILLDGLDEVATVDRRRAIVEWVNQLTDVFSGNQFIVTSRIMGYEKAPVEDGFMNYFVSDFDDKDISSFINNWYMTIETTLGDDSEYTRSKAEKEANDLISTIRGNDRIKRLSVNPLLLSIIATVHRYSGRLPDSRAKLYSDCIELLLGGKDEAIKFPLKLSQEKKLQVLMPLAYHMHCRETRNIELPELRKQLERHLPSVADTDISVDDFIEEVRNRSGLLVERGQGAFGFSHLTFQEYLTALYLKEQGDSVDLLISKKDSSWWRETILLYCGMVDVTPFVNRLLECREDILLGNLRLAGFCIGDAVKMTDQKLKRGVVDRLFDCYWNIIINRLRHEGFHSLAAIKDEKAVDKLIARLDDDDSSVRTSAASALGQIGSEKAVDKLIARLDDDDSDVRTRAAYALGHIGSEKVVDKLIARLEDDDSSVRTRAASALGQIGSEKAVDKLIARLDDDDSDVRYFAASALGQIGSEKAVDKLIARLEDDDSDVRTRAAYALGQIGSEKAVDKLIARLEDDDSDVRTRAASALGQIGSEKAVDKLIARLDDDDSDVRTRAASALGQIGSEKAVDKLIARLDDDDSDVRTRAASALGQIGSEKAVDKLIARLEDDDSDVRTRAAYALGQIGSEKAVDKLIARLDDDDRYVRSLAAYALGQIGSEKAVDKLIARLEDDDNNVRYFAASALGHIGSEKAVDKLIALLDDDDSGVRSNASYALVQIGSAKAVDAVKERLFEEGPSYPYIQALYDYLKTHKMYIDELPEEMIELNRFWKENVKKNAPC